MIDRINAALKVQNEPTKVPTSLYTSLSPHPLTLTSKNYKFKNKIINDTSLQKLTSIHLLYCCKLYNDNRALFTIDFTNTTPITSLITFLVSEIGGTEFTFLQHDNIIYAPDQEKIREGLDSLIPDTFMFINSGACITPALDDNLYFYNGKKCVTLKVEKVHVVYQERGVCIREYFQREIMCKACVKRVSTVMVRNDPILPMREKDLCDGCFKELFVTMDGKLRYEGMSYDKL